MQTQPVAYNESFNGNVYTANKLSKKPNISFNMVSDKIQNLIKDKSYDLYIYQDHIDNKIRIAVSYFKLGRIDGLLTNEEIPITAKASRYFYAAKRAIDNHEKMQKEKEQQLWDQEQKRNKKEEIKDIAETIIFAPLYITGSILENISPKLAKKFENLLQKIGI